MPVQVTVNLPRSAVDALQQLAARRNTTVTEVLRHAISMERQIDDELSRGARVLIEQGDTFRELVVRS